jgi:uncharacterized protein (TIGR02271 family)
VTDTTVNSLRAPGAETAEPGPEVSIPLHEEVLSVDRHVVESGRVQISQTTRTHEQAVDELLNHEMVEVEHVPVGRAIDSVPAVRQEGDVTIFPVVEEVLKIERRLVLKEEVHIRHVQRTERFQDTVTLRKQEAVVSRLARKGP